MGGLKKYMPITYWTSLIGSLALIGFPFFSGFFSKDAIIEAVHFAYHDLHRPGAMFAYYSVLIGVFITALYSFRMFFLVFHGRERMDEHTRKHLHETPWVVTGPLIALAIPSVLIGLFALTPMIFGQYFDGAIYVAEGNSLFAGHAEESALSQVMHFVLHAFTQLPVYFALAGLAAAYYLYMLRPDIPEKIAKLCPRGHKILLDKYGVDRFNDWFFAGGFRRIGQFFWQRGDVTVIDNGMVNGSASAVKHLSLAIRRIQTGFLYHYAFAMILGLLGLLFWFVN